MLALSETKMKRKGECKFRVEARDDLNARVENNEVLQLRGK